MSVKLKTTTSGPTPPDRQEIEAFLYHEARLLDEGRLDEWLALFTPDACYWIPCNADDVDPTRHVSLVYDDRQHLADRVWRLQSGWAHAQDPPSRTCRLVGNVAVTPGQIEGEAQVVSTFILVELRRGAQTTFAGRYEHRLRRVDGAYMNTRIARHYWTQIRKLPQVPVVYDPNLPHASGQWYLSSHKYPKVVEEFRRFMQTNKAEVEELKKKYNFVSSEDQ